MAATTSKLQIIQRAASNTGNGWIAALDDGSDVARIVDVHYEGIVEELLCSGSRNFARRVTQLSKLDLTPERPWRSLWQRPPGCLALRSVQDDCAVRVDHEERDTESGGAIATLYCGDVAHAVYVARVPENRWPADFAAAVQLRMEAVFLSAIAEQRQEAQGRERRADGKAVTSSIRDKTSSSPADPTEWDLTRARRRTGRWDLNRA